MNVFDYIILGVAAVCFIIGLIRGLLKQVFSVGGVFVVFYGASELTPYAQELLGKIIPDVATSSTVCFIVAAVVILIAWSLISGLICKIVNNGVLGGINRLLGGVLGVAIVYCIMAVVVALYQAPNFMPELTQKLAPTFEGEGGSWIISNVFSSNPVGNWLVNAVTEFLSTMVAPA